MEVPPGYVGYPRPDQVDRPRQLRPDAELAFDPIGRAWQLLMSDIGTWIAIVVVVAVASIALSIPVGIISSVGSFPFGQNPKTPTMTVGGLAFQQGLGILVGVPMSLLYAGIVRVAQLKNRGLPATFSEAFGWNGMAGQLALAALLVSLAQAAIQFAFMVPLYGSMGTFKNTTFGQIFNPMTIGIFVVVAIVAWFVTACLMLVQPIILDQKVSAADAISMSFSILARKPLVAMCFILVTHLIALSGVIACCLGLFLTGAFPYIANAVAYDSMSYDPQADVSPPTGFGSGPSGFQV